MSINDPDNFSGRVNLAARRLGAPLWYAQDLDGNCRFFRAASRDMAKAAIRADFPDAKFYR